MVHYFKRTVPWVRSDAESFTADSGYRSWSWSAAAPTVRTRKRQLWYMTNAVRAIRIYLTTFTFQSCRKPIFLHTAASSSHSTIDPDDTISGPNDILTTFFPWVRRNQRPLIIAYRESQPLLRCWNEWQHLWWSPEGSRIYAEHMANVQMVLMDEKNSYLTQVGHLVLSVVSTDNIHGGVGIPGDICNPLLQKPSRRLQTWSKWTGCLAEAVELTAWSQDIERMGMTYLPAILFDHRLECLSPCINP